MDEIFEFDETEYARLSTLMHSGEASAEEEARFWDIQNSVFRAAAVEEVDENEAYLEHYGTPRHSGRYPWGSGDDPYQHEAWYRGRERLRKQGLTETEIAKVMHLTRPEYQARVSIATTEMRKKQYEEAERLYAELGPKWTEIGRRMGGLSESTVRSMLKPGVKDRLDSTQKTANILKSAVDKDHYILVGTGTESMLGVTKDKLTTSLEVLKDQGYNVYKMYVPQIGRPGQKTTLQVLCPPDVTFTEAAHNRDRISTIFDYRSTEEGAKKFGIEDPAPVSSKRVMVKYAEDGGDAKDGIIELRRGVEELSLGASNYAQVRISVDGTHYLKGMAIYADDLPEGVDIRFNTSKHSNVPMMGDKDNTVLKPMKLDEAHRDNPFGAQIRVQDGEVVGQRHYTDENGNDRLSPINIVNEEGDWGRWSKTLPAQFASKQPPETAKKQLDLQYEKFRNELDTINELTVPEVKKKMLDAFAKECDRAAVNLKAHSLPDQGAHVILPLESLKEDEIFAPNYRNGEDVILVRYPHEGTFQIPHLYVNNKNKEGIRNIGLDAPDAVGINPATARQLSGADFDGDTVTVIPVRGQNLRWEKAQKELLDYADTFHDTYAYHDGMKVLPKTMIQREMGTISNLITDMTIQDAPLDELIRATKHSMLIIDANKHRLDYMQSYEDNGIQALKDKYQPKDDPSKSGGGASTLISRSKSKEYVLDRTEGAKLIDPETGKERRYQADPETGEKLYTPTGKPEIKRTKDKETGEVHFDPTGKLKTIPSTKMAETDDARTLMSNGGKGKLIERIYAEYANRMKYLGNEARKESIATPNSKIDPEAKKVYKEEVDSLARKIEVAKANRPLEQKAQLLANEMMRLKKLENPSMSDDEEDKEKSKTITYARNAVGADKKAANVVITDKEWQAILSGAVSTSRMNDIFANTDLDRLKQLATPKTDNGLSDSMVAKIKRYGNIRNADGSARYSNAEIAEVLGVSATTVSNTLNS